LRVPATPSFRVVVPRCGHWWRWRRPWRRNVRGISCGRRITQGTTRASNNIIRTPFVTAAKNERGRWTRRKSKRSDPDGDGEQSPWKYSTGAHRCPGRRWSIERPRSYDEIILYTPTYEPSNQTWSNRDSPAHRPLSCTVSRNRVRDNDARYQLVVSRLYRGRPRRITVNAYCIVIQGGVAQRLGASWVKTLFEIRRRWGWTSGLQRMFLYHNETCSEIISGFFFFFLRSLNQIYVIEMYIY
jgi:hypothetical protein